MNAAVFKKRRRLPEDKINVTFDVAILEILPPAFCVKRILPAEKTAIFEDNSIGFRQDRDGLRALPERIFKHRELPDNFRNFWDLPNLLLQKFPAPNFTATTKLTFTPRTDGEKTGLIITGLDYAYISVEKRLEGLFVSQTIVKDAEKGAAEIAGKSIMVENNVIYLRVKVTEDSRAQFAFSTDGKNFTGVGESFTARKGKWVGARVGIFAVRTGKTRETGYADFDWFRIE